VVVEEGDPEQVVKRPQHDYTKLLIGSIPIADPSRKWGEGLEDDNAPLNPERASAAMQGSH